MILELILMLNLSILGVTIGLWIHYCCEITNKNRRFKKVKLDNIKSKVREYINKINIKYIFIKYNKNIEYELDCIEKEKLGELIANTFNKYNEYDNWMSVVKNRLHRRNYYIID